MDNAFARLRSALADHYRFESELGAGGMATVHLVTDLRHHRPVALKVLRPEFVAAVGRERFLREIDTLGQLRHPHILPLLDSGSVDGLCYFVMPYCEDETLRERLDREGPLPIDEAVRYAIEVAEALGYAHAHGVVHRDVKPQNIMLESGHAVLADFGIALALDALPGDRLTSTGHSPGTPHYMSPEQALAHDRIDARSDLYSLGCVLYEMLVGQPPFTGPNVHAILARHALESPPHIRVVRDTVSESLEAAVFRALAKAPADRFRTAGEMRAALQEVTHERVRQTGPLRTPAAATDGAAGTAPLPSGRRPSVGATALRATALVGGAALLLTIVGFLTINAYDLKIGVPDRFAPSRSDYLVVGARATLGPFVIGTIIAGIAFLLGYLVRLGFATIAHAGRTGVGLAARIHRLRSRWFGFWESTRPSAVADAFFGVSVVLAAAVIVVSWPFLSAHFTPATAVFGCAQQNLQRTVNVVSAALIFALGFGWVGVFGWLRRRYGAAASPGTARWASAAIIILMILVVTLPWRLLWFGGNERVIMDGERGYVISESPTHLILYNAERGTTHAYPADSLPPLQRVGITGRVFEEPDAFYSGAIDCTGIS